MEEFRFYENYMIFCILSESFTFPVNPMLKPFYKTTIKAKSLEDAMQQYKEWKG